MEDTGFYRADFTKATLSAWGAGQGCAFAEYDAATARPCTSWNTIESVRQNNVDSIDSG